MGSIATLGSLSPAELALLALIGLTLVLPVVLALALERFVYEGEAADPVGIAEFERRFDHGEAWTERLREGRRR